MTASEKTITTAALDGDVQRRVDPGQPVSEAVVLAVADAAGHDVLGGAADGLAPLYEAVDPDALNALFQGGLAGANQLTVTFDYSGHQVTVAHDGTVTVDER